MSTMMKGVSVKKSSTNNINKPIYKLPFKHGWKREIVQRKAIANKNNRSDVYYYSPANKKFRSLKQIKEELPKNSVLKIKHFSMIPHPTGVKDKKKEMTRKADKKPSNYASFRNAIFKSKRVTAKVGAATSRDNLTPLKTTTPTSEYMPKKRTATKLTVSQPKRKTKMKNSTNVKQRIVHVHRSTPNRYSTLSIKESNVDDVFTDPNQEQLDTTHNTPKSILPPPIFVKGVIDYIGLRNSIIEIIGLDSFSSKSTSPHLKIQTDTPDNYRNLISFLKNIEAQFHTYQPQSYKALRIVIRNLHPSTLTANIASALKYIGYTIKNVTNVIHQQTKMYLPLFVNIDLNGNNSNIFDISSLLHTKVKIEETPKKRLIPQCQNCQNYGHTRTYCVHRPMCVKCGSNHSSSTCTSSDLPAKCALNGPHPANYKGCTIYKQLSRKHNFSSNKIQQLPPPNPSHNPKHRHQQLATENSNNPHSYANVTENLPPPNPNPSSTTNNEI
ncbi:Pre-C2HC domain,Methyl-CpG DNA binding,DNA-binding domain [Cinara cedri]|uniref:Pre-C2HC domain,Methyl-CpG DNA binding,DNA-binding domain n=1 Tax=Cinara cedri TaxID=506608 RepID=A0A5E4MMI5_9HEMI|nr:Pre-C2HC domain,Methyl-CpG DNA binding,DNA-binding domain [Cinara cedri]